MKMPGVDADVYFGSLDDVADWDVDDDEDPDDEELETTPADVVALLGFDPKEIDDDSEAGEKWEAGLLRVRPDV